MIPETRLREDLFLHAGLEPGISSDYGAVRRARVFWCSYGLLNMQNEVRNPLPLLLRGYGASPDPSSFKVP